jgi:peptidoglycan/xylan/chitin deacetylase (PgdA/CDA1 family)
VGRGTPADLVRRVGARAASCPPVARRVAASPRARGRTLVLLWHRIAPEDPPPHTVVPTVTEALLERQLSALAEVVDVVGIDEALRAERDGRARVVLTFDDDHPAHVRHALPVLRRLGLPATFFLSGRWLHGLGPYWWEVLEDAIARDGLDTTARRLGATAGDPFGLAAAVEGTPAADRLAAEASVRVHVETMPGTHALALRDAGMDIGFHTLHHPVLPRLDDDEARRALTEGRDELASYLGRTLDTFAYPHGKVDARTARLTAEAGFASAWTCHHQPADHRTSHVLQGRWEPGAREPGALVRGVLRRLHLPAEAPA